MTTIDKVLKLLSFNLQFFFFNGAIKILIYRKRTKFPISAQVHLSSCEKKYVFSRFFSQNLLPKVLVSVDPRPISLRKNVLITFSIWKDYTVGMVPFNYHFKIFYLRVVRQFFSSSIGGVKRHYIQCTFHL